MDCEIKKSIDVYIRLTEDEARWLKGFIQNYPGEPENESKEHNEYRKKLFDLLSLK